MKKIYEIPAVELKKFDVENIITASSDVISNEEFMSNAVADINGEKKKITAVASWNSNWNDTFGL